MRRRTYLTTITATASISLTGCMNSSDGLNPVDDLQITRTNTTVKTDAENSTQQPVLQAHIEFNRPAMVYAFQPDEQTSNQLSDLPYAPAGWHTIGLTSTGFDSGEVNFTNYIKSTFNNANYLFRDYELTDTTEKLPIGFNDGDTIRFAWGELEQEQPTHTLTEVIY